MQIPMPCSRIVEIYACPNCGKEVAYLFPVRNRQRFLDGTKSRCWSDFLREAKCQNCSFFFDLGYMNRVRDREVTFDGDITFAKKPTFDDYQEKIKLGLGGELTNRLGLWRYGNIISKEFNSEQYRENCKRLIEMVEHIEMDDFKLILAELYRNIGEFDKCLSIINLLWPDYDWLKSSFQKQCFAKNTKRFRLPQEYSTYEKDE